MTKKQRQRLVDQILGELKIAATQNNKIFDEADTFFSLVFMGDKELLQVAKLCNVTA